MLLGWWILAIGEATSLEFPARDPLSRDFPWDPSWTLGLNGVRLAEPPYKMQSYSMRRCPRSDAMTDAFGAASALGELAK